jgi:hypothetical protein
VGPTKQLLAKSNRAQHVPEQLLDSANGSFRKGEGLLLFRSRLAPILSLDRIRFNSPLMLVAIHLF